MKHKFVSIGLLLFCILMGVNSSSSYAQGGLKPICQEGGHLLIEVLETALKKWTTRRMVSEAAEDFSTSFFRHRFAHLMSHFSPAVGRSLAHSVFTITEKEFALITEKALEEVLVVVKKMGTAELDQILLKGKTIVTEAGRKVLIKPEINPLISKRIILNVEMADTIGYLSEKAMTKTFSHITYIIRMSRNKSFGEFVTTFPAPAIAASMLPFVPIALIRPQGLSDTDSYAVLIKKYPTMINKLTDIVNSIVLNVVEESLRFKVQYQEEIVDQQKATAWWEYLAAFPFLVVADPFMGLDEGGLAKSTAPRFLNAQLCFPENRKNNDLEAWLKAMGIVGPNAQNLKDGLWREIIAPSVDAASGFEFDPRSENPEMTFEDPEQ